MLVDNSVYKPVYKWICHVLPGLILALGGLIFAPELMFKNLYYKNLTRARGGRDWLWTTLEKDKF